MSRTTLGAPPGNQAGNRRRKFSQRGGWEDRQPFSSVAPRSYVLKSSSSYPEILTAYLINYSNLKPHQICVCPIFLYLDQIQEINNLQSTWRPAKAICKLCNSVPALSTMYSARTSRETSFFFSLSNAPAQIFLVDLWALILQLLVWGTSRKQ